MNKEVYLENWNLDSIFEGGSDSPVLIKLIEQTKIEIKEIARKVDALQVSNEQLGEKILGSLLKDMGKIQTALSQMTSFASCLLAEHPDNKKVVFLQGQTSVVNNEYITVLQRFQKLLSQLDQTPWTNLLETESLKEYRFILNEWRQKADSKLSSEAEKLISDLMYDGYHGWNDLYRSILNNLKVSIDMNGTKKELSVGQANNLRFHVDQQVREEAFKALEQLWTAQEDIMARILNHITGFRIQVNQKRGTINCLEQPLKDNRMKEETLQTMWQVVTRHKQSFADYLDHKAKLSGNNEMPSYDFWAPFKASKTSIPYPEAADFILQQFQQSGPELENFARTAFEEGWVEAESRPRKSAIAICAGFPLTGESRVFLTYEGTMTNLLTLTHELGHAFHNHAMKPVNPLNRKYGMTTAETASTFAEMIVLDAAINQAENTEEKLFLLDEKIKRSAMNFMNLHARFLFEERLYEERKNGMVAAERLNEMMRDALAEGYGGSMSHLPIHSWISTPHFYITSSPFYNFPYTFGYLFSVSIYAKAKEEGKEFEQSYLSLLRDSGSMTVEELAMKHLGEDITQESFWEKGMALCVNDVEEFIRLSSVDLVNQIN
ncbi:M3 family oligoendopeptidase [Planomicrobium sp. CPCC 101079]|uniref:M3 family oligoendopeptidase n=1 Tax=Planomicrobium sp. CPCC 101079 TaxID=2599618 RepID=UPI0011B76B8C|nr:M3 family oligoendopeptidase [Planomicrobium sp. CPCC 101079]TWT00132.1 M3 family oligoendopeptidase [Planomicrobium sp. CPCC 101079]